MGHRFKKPSPSTRMYRHFAVITLVATGLLALFADGEQARAVTEEIQAKQEQEALHQESKEKLAERGEVQQPSGVWGDSSDGLENWQFDRFSIGSGSSILGDTLSGLGYSPEYLARMSADERDALAAAAAANMGGSRELAGYRSASLEAESRFRSGSVAQE